MALKYWYVASNGSAAWSVAGNWYNGSGGTGGVAGVPTTADDAIVDAASGSGTLTISATATCNSLNTLAFTGTFTGGSALNIVTSSIASNSGFVLQLGGNHTYSGTITFTTTIPATTATLYINCNDIFHKGNMTFNTATAYWEGWDTINYEPIRLTGTFLLTSGYVYSVALYAGIVSTSNSNFRVLAFVDVYLSGTGTLIVATTQTNLSWNANNIYVTNTTSTAKTITFSSNVYSTGLYIQGSGASATTVAVAATTGSYPDIYVSKTDGTLIFNTTYLTNLTFIEGTTVSWGGTANIFIYGNVTMCNSVINGATNPLNFVKAGAQIFTTFNKTFAGALTINDGGNNQLQFFVYGSYLSTSSITMTSLAEATFYNYVSLNLGINITALASGGFPNIYFNGGIANATTLAITEAYVYLGSTYLSGGLTLTSGALQLLPNSVHSILTFTSSSASLYRSIYLGINTTINLRGGVANTWNTSQGVATGVLYFDPQTSTINIIENTSSQVLSFQTGGCNFYNLHINRSNNTSIVPLTIFTGNFSCMNFRDFTIMSAGTNCSISFAGGTTVTIFDTFQVGNDVNQTFIASSSTTAVFLQKGNRGLVICPRVVVYNMNALNLNTFYAIKGSINNGGNNGGWIFDNLPRRLGSLGAG